MRMFKRNQTLAIGIGICLLTLGAVLAILLPYFIGAPQSQPQSQPQNPIQIENSRPGTPGWEITRPALKGEIQAYAGEDSIEKGETVHLYVSTTAPSFTIDIYRLGYYHGVGARLMKSILDNPGIAQGYYLGRQSGHPIDCPTCTTSYRDVKGQETHLIEANWSLTNSIEFPSPWLSGIYYIKLTTSTTGAQWSVPVVVRDDERKAAFIFEDPVNTDQAYNEWGGASLYFNYLEYGPTGESPLDKHTGQRAPYWAFYVSFNRPYAQKVGAGSGFLFSWTYPMAKFMEERGYDVTYTTNSAVAEGRSNLLNYKAFISPGHDEYWSYVERSKLEAAIAAGMSVAFFGANNIYWQIRTAPDKQQHAQRWIICYKDYNNREYPDPYDTPGNANRYLTTTLWRSVPVNMAEDRVLKAMYPIGGGGGTRDLIVKNTGSWVFNGTNLRDGDKIDGIVGYEIDTLFSNDGSLTANDQITVIADSPYKGFRAMAVLDELKGKHNIIFDAGTIYWPEGLEGGDPYTPASIQISAALRQITSNILTRMASA